MWGRTRWGRTRHGVKPADTFISQLACSISDFYLLMSDFFFIAARHITYVDVNVALLSFTYVRASYKTINLYIEIF